MSAAGRMPVRWDSVRATHGNSCSRTNRCTIHARLRSCREARTDSARWRRPPVGLPRPDRIRGNIFLEEFHRPTDTRRLRCRHVPLAPTPLRSAIEHPVSSVDSTSGNIPRHRASLRPRPAARVGKTSARARTAELNSLRRLETARSRDYSRGILRSRKYPPRLDEPALRWPDRARCPSGTSRLE